MNKMTLTLTVTVLCAGLAYSADWPQFLGPEANGIAPDTGINKDWSARPPQELWRVELSDNGYAGPSVAEGKVFIIDRDGDNDVVRAIDFTTGEDVWTFSYPDPGKDNYGYARATPVFSEGRLYTLGRMGQLHCLNAGDGTVVWSRDIRQEFGGRPPNWLYAMSPKIDGEKLIVCPGGETGVAALNRDTGETLWTGGLDGLPGYATPAVAELQGRKQYVIFAGVDLYGVDAETGGEALWQIPWENRSKVNAAVPLVAEDFVFITSDYGLGCALVYVGPEGAKTFWKNEQLQAHFNTPVYYKGYFFGIGNAGRGGDLMCLSPQNGQPAWRQEGFEKGGLVAVDDVLIAIGGATGDVVMVDATAESYRELGRIKPLGGQSWTAPIIADGKLIVRNKSAMVCLDLM